MNAFKNGLILFITCLSLTSYAQQVSVKVSYDTVYAGNVLAVQFVMENWDGDLQNPDFVPFERVGGPQITSSMSISGGERQSSKSLLYYLKPPEKPGKYTIPAQKLAGRSEVKETEKITIVVLENPENVKQNPVFKEKRRSSPWEQMRRKSPPRGNRQKF